MRRFALPVTLSLLALAAICTAQVDQQKPTGYVSYIEPDAKLEILSQSDPRRLPTGFVEVVHGPNLERCKRSDYQNCAKFEWSVPFMPEDNAKRIERGLSEAWNRFDARTFWRVQTAINGLAAQVLNCMIGVTNFDVFLGAWDRQLITNQASSEFCDDLNTDLALYIPVPCPWLETFTFWDRVGQLYAEAYSYAVAHYAPDYWADVAKLAAREMPLALPWDGVYPVLPGQESGLLWQPIISTPNPAQYIELARVAQAKDARGFAYMLARYPFLNQLGGPVLGQLGQAIRRLPGEGDADGQPGLSQLEQLKSSLAKREGIFSRPFQWADLTATGPEPQDVSGAATAYEYAGVGHVTALALQSKFVTEISPRVPIFWRSCWTVSVPPILVPVPTPMPILHLLPRVETFWQSIPEGYPIPGVKNTPLW